jgi:hypothetical protein
MDTADTILVVGGLVHLRVTMSLPSLGTIILVWGAVKGL